MIPIWVAIVGGLFSVLVLLAKQWFEVRSVNIAVLAEIERLSQVLISHKVWWTGAMGSGNTELPLIPFTTPVFDGQAKSIGQLKHTIVADVVRFYGYIRFVNALQSLRRVYKDLGKEAQFDDQYLHVLEHAISDYKAFSIRSFNRMRLLGATALQPSDEC